jgi:hypothetical protein
MNYQSQRFGSKNVLVTAHRSSSVVLGICLWINTHKTHCYKVVPPR